MIYPQKLSSKKGEKILNILLITTIIISILLVIINKLATPQTHWAAIANCGIIYVWVTVLYSIKKGTNIAGHVLLQMLTISAAMLYIDAKIGKLGWSINIAIPITLIVANVTMLILTIISYKKYIKYAIYQLIIVLISLIPMLLIVKNIIQPQILIHISSLISILSLAISLILCYKDVKEAIIRKIHM